MTTRVEWGKRTDFAEAAETLGVTTDCIMAVIVPPGQTETYYLFSQPDAPTDIYRVRLARDHYGVLRQSSEVVPMPGLGETLQAALKARITEVLQLCTVRGLKEIITAERENGHAFGMVAEACRDELAKRCERE